MKFIPAGVRHLKRADPVLRRLIARLGPCELKREAELDEFGALADAIIYQQIAYAAAQSISRRFQALYADKGSPRGRLPRPAELLQTHHRRLRSVGLSRQKVRYLGDLARKACDGKLRLGRFARMSDDEVIENLTQVLGIGRWTAEMFLMFSLGRPDVLPVDDLGFRYGVRDAYGFRSVPAEKTIRRIAEAWRPYRTVGTWYMWRLRREALLATAKAKGQSKKDKGEGVVSSPHQPFPLFALLDGFADHNVVVGVLAPRSRAAPRLQMDDAVLGADSAISQPRVGQHALLDFALEAFDRVL